MTQDSASVEQKKFLGALLPPSDEMVNKFLDSFEIKYLFGYSKNLRLNLICDFVRAVPDLRKKYFLEDYHWTLLKKGKTVKINRASTLD